MEAVSREDGLFENIMRTFEKDDKIYAVPLASYSLLSRVTKPL